VRRRLGESGLRRPDRLQLLTAGVPRAHAARRPRRPDRPTRRLRGAALLDRCVLVWIRPVLRLRRRGAARAAPALARRRRRRRTAGARLDLVVADVGFGPTWR